MNVVSETLALEILGEDKVINVEQAVEVWGVKSFPDASIHYSEQDLRYGAAQNRKGNADFRLVRVCGLWNLLEMQKQFPGGTPILGECTRSHPCFSRNENTWWLESRKENWMTRRPIPGYYFFDFHGRWGEMSWRNQEARIKASGKAFGLNFERADEVALVEAIFSIFMLTSERLLETWYHWSSTLHGNDYHIHVGNFNHHGLCVRPYHTIYEGFDTLRVVRSLKFSC